MEELKQRILNDGRLLDGYILKVDNFLNHQLDVQLLDNMGKAFAERFAGVEIDKILTIEASGIAVACMAARHFNHVPVVFAKKTQSLNMDQDAYESEVFSYTKQQGYKVRVSHRYLHKGERVLIMDDFLAHGNASLGLIDLVKQAEAIPVGVGIVIEKGFQDGGKAIRDAGVQLESLAVLGPIENGTIEFLD
ncbi:MAG: xanthine phosphoribosyltransferase [Neisseriaceae bacterium]|nr:xanthine phosphoribosyltransferase [Neisseriaceae bacterium]MBP6861103.1 xanthine phosphoribosyltransferase [Neisseriaceae bacterium]